MLYHFEKPDTQINQMCRKDFFDHCMKNLSATDYDAISDYMIEKLSNNKKVYSSLITPEEWATVYRPVAVACSNDTQTTAFFIGLLFYNVYMNCNFEVFFIDTVLPNGVETKAYWKK